MPSTPFDSAHQKSLRALIGKVLPNARAQHIAEALAAGYGFPTHRAFGAVIRAVEAGRRPSPAPDFDVDRLIVRLHELGENVGSRDQALRFLFGVVSDGPRSGSPAEPDASDEALPRRGTRPPAVHGQSRLQNPDRQPHGLRIRLRYLARTGVGRYQGRGGPAGRAVRCRGGPPSSCLPGPRSAKPACSSVSRRAAFIPIVTVAGNPVPASPATPTSTPAHPRLANPKLTQAGTSPIGLHALPGRYEARR